MPRLNIVKESDIIRTARVAQCEGLFDIPPTQKSQQTWALDFELPDKWNIGLIVGPSGSGKSSLLNTLYPGKVGIDFLWSKNKSILDDFPKQFTIKEILELLSSVGFSSPPSWLRSYKALSNGEQFRVKLARILAEQDGVAVIDEFTSVVDRTVARIASAAFQKTIRKRQRRAVLASCHYDIIIPLDKVFELY